RREARDRAGDLEHAQLAKPRDELEIRELAAGDRELLQADQLRERRRLGLGRGGDPAALERRAALDPGAIGGRRRARDAGVAAAPAFAASAAWRRGAATRRGPTRARRGSSAASSRAAGA